MCEILASKPDGEKYIVYADAQILTTSVHNIFRSALQHTPRQITAACDLSKAILAPSVKEKKNLIKAAVGVAGGTAGIGMVIGAIGVALGWGVGLTTTVATVFIASEFAGPIAWGVTGLGIAALAGYFASTSSHETDSERFIHVLTSSTEKAVETIWDKHGVALSKSVDNNPNIPNTNNPG